MWKNKIFSILLLMGVIGMWAGFFKLMEIIPLYWSPASLIYFILALALLVGVVIFSFILVVVALVVWNLKL